MIDCVTNTPIVSVNIGDILAKVGQGSTLNIRGLQGSSFAYLTSKLWMEHKNPVVLICKDAATAEVLQDDIAYFTASHEPGSIKIFPSPTSLPYTHLIPQTDTWIERLSVLYTLENEAAPLIIAPIDAILRKVPSSRTFYDNIEYLIVGQRIDRERFLEKIVHAGYNNSPLVEGEGEFASRGYIIDIWSPASERPVRVELDGESIASIRSFDPRTQKTSFSIDRVTVIPVRSVILTDEVMNEGLARLKKVADESGFPVVERREYSSSVKAGIYPAFTETLLPIFHPDAETLLDYLKGKSNNVIPAKAGIQSRYPLDSCLRRNDINKKTLFLIPDLPDVKERSVRFHEALANAHSEATHIEKLVEPRELYLNYSELARELSGRPLIVTNDVDLTSLSSQRTLGTHDASGDPGFRRDDGREGDDGPKIERVSLAFSTTGAKPIQGKWIEGSSEGSLTAFVSQLNAWHKEKVRVIIACHTPMQADRMVDLLRWQGMAPRPADTAFAELATSYDPNASIMVGSLSEGFIWPDEHLAVIAEKDLFGKRKKRISYATKYPTEAFASYQELTKGDFLVHIMHGVGRYKAMRQMEFAGMKNDFLEMEYLGGDKLFVPAYRLGLIQRYIGPGEGGPFLDKLGGGRWQKEKLKADRAVRKMAAELLKLYAKRKVADGYAFSGRDHLMEEFEAAFPYDETPDQLQAIEETLKDMAEPHPADRLICGDVGYGKTEVAIRAAFKAAVDGKQVALLVPTTILALQHYETFKERFKNTGLTVELLSRFRTKQEQKKVVEGIQRGTVDIVVGTHRLIQKDIGFRDLGLLIVDEEHRFGVRQKEAIKKLKNAVDVISMSATPIPRSLHISLVGARDISVINTPPAHRMAIRTYVAEFDEGMIRGAVLKEIRRGGQVFFLHNRVETIQSMQKRLAKLLPEVKIRVAHGQMGEDELETVMVDFLHGEFDVLLTTTIIESGLDIPSANTIIVNRADTFGLAQLYQIRGRVGRSSSQAYAYLLIPEQSDITAIASKRLATLQKYTELGAGFQIAMHDLEIRGSGNILGAEQSGHISAIGYELYTELLEKEIRKLKGEDFAESVETEIQIPVEAYLPNDYITDDGIRMVFYKRLSALKSSEEVDQLAVELTDRFGGLPTVVQNLLKVVEVKTAASALGIESIQSGKGNFVYKFSESTHVSPEAIMKLVKKNAKRMTIKPPSTVIVRDEAEIFSAIRRHLAEFRKGVD